MPVDNACLVFFLVLQLIIFRLTYPIKAENYRHGTYASKYVADRLRSKRGNYCFLSSIKAMYVIQYTTAGMPSEDEQTLNDRT